MDILLQVLRQMREQSALFVLVGVQIAVTTAVAVICWGFVVMFVSDDLIPGHTLSQDLLIVEVDPLQVSSRWEEEGRCAEEDRAILESVSQVEGAAIANLLWPETGSVCVGREGEFCRTLAFEALVDHRILDVTGGKIAGRMFTPEELRSGADVVVLSKFLADALFPGADPMGSTIVDAQRRSLEVVGVVDFFSLPHGTFSEGGKTVLRPWVPRCGAPGRFVVRAAPWEARAVQERVRKSLLRADSQRAVEVKLLGDVEEPIAQARLAGALFNGATFGMVLLISVLGMAALVTLRVRQRTREIGIRRALGATRGDILFYFLMEYAVLCGVGIFVGDIMGTLTLELLSAQITRLRWTWGMEIACVGTFASVCMLSVVGPVWHAASTPPSEATRVG